MGKNLVKDLKLVTQWLNNHDLLRKTIIIDNLKESFQMQPGNGIKIRDWYGTDFNDKELFNLIPYLKQLAKDQTQDIRSDLKKCNNCTTFISGAMT